MPRKPFLPTHRPPTHPGKMLLKEFLEPGGVSITAFAKAIGLSRVAISEIINGRRGISPLTALRFSKALGTTQQFWLNLQLASDIYEANHSEDAAKIAEIQRICFPDAT
jgi:addiction module HigA family antidote